VHPRDPSDDRAGIQVGRVIDEAADEGQPQRSDAGDRAVGDGAPVHVVHVRHGEAQRTGGSTKHREQLTIHERDRIAPQQFAARGNPEEQPAATGGGRGTDRARLPEQDVSPGGLRGGRLGDRAPVAPEDEADPLIREVVHGARGGIAAGDIQRSELDRSPADPPVGVHQIGRERDTAELVPSPGALGTTEGIDRTDPDRLRAPRARDAAGEQRGDRQHGERPSHRRTATRFATTCVVAGAPHPPDAHRCHDNRSPAPRSTQKTAGP